MCGACKCNSIQRLSLSSRINPCREPCILTHALVSMSSVPTWCLLCPTALLLSIMTFDSFGLTSSSSSSRRTPTQGTQKKAMILMVLWWMTCPRKKISPASNLKMRRVQHLAMVGFEHVRSVSDFHHVTNCLILDLVDWGWQMLLYVIITGICPNEAKTCKKHQTTLELNS